MLCICVNRCYVCCRCHPTTLTTYWLTMIHFTPPPSKPEEAYWIFTLRTTKEVQHKRETWPLVSRIVSLMWNGNLLVVTVWIGLWLLFTCSVQNLLWFYNGVSLLCYSYMKMLLCKFKKWFKSSFYFKKEKKGLVFPKQNCQSTQTVFWSSVQDIFHTYISKSLFQSLLMMNNTR